MSGGISRAEKLANFGACRRKTAKVTRRLCVRGLIHVGYTVPGALFRPAAGVWNPSARRGGPFKITRDVCDHRLSPHHVVHPQSAGVRPPHDVAALEHKFEAASGRHLRRGTPATGEVWMRPGVAPNWDGWFCRLGRARLPPNLASFR